MPMVNGHLHLNYSCLTASDQILIKVSKDSVTWTTLFTSVPAMSKDTFISLYNFINPKIKSACHQLYILTQLQTLNGNINCTIKQFDFSYTLQMSKYLFPSLLVGHNQIKLQSQSTPNYLADVSIKWKENFSNHPPSPPQYAVYPLLGDTVQNTNITFKWQQIWQDQDNDSIKEWHFILSEFPDFRHPLSNSFNQYSGGITNFNIADSWNAFNTLKVYPNFYNHLNTYYWKVRIMDKKGAWSDWSPIWHFTVKCPMHPVNVHFEKTNIDTSYSLVWKNQSIGETIQKYFIYGSSSNKLPIDQIYLRDSISQSGYTVGMNTVKMLRLVGKDNIGNSSTPTRIAYMPYKDTTVYGDTLDFTFLIDSLQKPFPSYPGLERNYFLQADTNYFSLISSTKAIPKKAGACLLNICYTKEDLIDTLYRQQIDFTILKANLTIQANNITSIYGDQPIFNGSTYSGFKINDTEFSLDTLPSYNTTATPLSPIGIYPLIVYGAASNNYNLNYINGVCEVIQANLNITAKDTASTIGDIPVLNGVQISGFKNGENSSILLAQPVVYSSVNASSPVGIYPIYADSAQALNYSINYLAGTFTVFPIALNTHNIDQSNSVRISPNPSIGQFDIYLDNSNLGSELILYDAVGKQMYKQILVEKSNRINVNLCAGIYLLKIMQKGEKMYESKIRIQ